MKTLTESQDLADLDAEAAGGDARPPGDGAVLRVGQRVGHFRLLALLGSGGMGVVYLAEDLTLRRRVALKLLPAAAVAAPVRRARFLREARAASAVAHPAVAAVFEVGEEGDDLFLVMEYVAGRTLHDRIAERGAMDLGEVRRIAVAVAAGMVAAHEAGVIHRDLKPANLMIAAADQGVKILDFGIARWIAPESEPLASALTVTAGASVEGRILGTPGYMAPEQIHGRAVDGRADVFAFGVVLYEMITGSRPFAGETALERLVAVDRDAPRPSSSLRPGVPAALDRVVQRCLEKRPEDRFDGFREVLVALEAPSIPAPRARRAPRLGLGLVVVGLAIAAQRALRTRSAAPVAVPAAPPALRRPCLDGESGGAGCKDPAWCDAGGHALACCGKGLVATGTDGICGCAPGGTAVREALDRGCPAGAPAGAGTYDEARDRAAQKAIDCMVPGIDAGWSRGGEFSVGFFLTPEGEVFGARLGRSTIPEIGAQACVLAALRSTHFPPPHGEDVGREQAWGLVFK
jgi:tRNA A-37 threonylcarbamoyl transferase component Bud32